jgi:hypothetical protein
VAPTSLGAGGLGKKIGDCSQGTESSPILALLPDLQICKFVKAYAHNPVNLDAVAASSSASPEATGVWASTLLGGGGLLALLFCGLVFFAVRLRLIFAFCFLTMYTPLDFISPGDGRNISGVFNCLRQRTHHALPPKNTAIKPRSLLA